MTHVYVTVLACNLVMLYINWKLNRIAGHIFTT